MFVQNGKGSSSGEHEISWQISGLDICCLHVDVQEEKSGHQQKQDEIRP